jgi:amino-acid N-acetyltransferase
MPEHSKQEMIRKARMDDVRHIHRLLQHYADKKLLLGRSISSLYDHLRDFVVFEQNGSGLSGVCSLHICWEDLAEIRSLAVVEATHGKGVGRRLVEHCLDEAAALGISRVFTLTYQPQFFRKLGFNDIDKRELPHKIWSDCLNCTMFPDCDEEALLYETRN